MSETVAEATLDLSVVETVDTDDFYTKEETDTEVNNVREDCYTKAELGESLSYESGENVNGLKIAVEGSDYELNITNKQIEFIYQGTPVAYINGNKLVIPKSVMLDEMMVGDSKWSWRIRSNDNLQLKWIG